MKTLAIPAVLAFLAPIGVAQAVYVDCSSATAPLPSTAYGAAQGIPGQWNRLTVDSAQSLFDRDGNATGISARVPASSATTTETSVSGVSADEALLLRSTFESTWAPMQLELSNLPGGDYQVVLISTYVHGYGPGAFTFHGNVDGSPTGTFSFGEIPTQPYAYGFGYRLLHMPAGGAVQIDVEGTFAGFLLVHLSDATPYCFGNLGDCPCASGAGGAGCPSSFASSGASLAGSGSHSVSYDTFQLVASGVSDAMALLFQGTSIAGSGRGVPFGDGLRCASGAIRRVGLKLATGNSVQFPGPGDAPISVLGGLDASGGFRAYQVWYRNPASYCTGAAFNTTNGVAVQWAN